MKWTLPLLFAIFMAACASSPTNPQQESSELTLILEDKIIREDVKRFGVNLSQHQFWGSNQIMKNLISTNPGFEPWTYGSITKVSEASPGRFIDEGPRGAWKLGFWNNARYEVILGPSKGQTGLIQTFTPSNDPKSGSSYILDSKVTLASGDFLALRKENPGDGYACWKVSTRGEGAVEAETQDLGKGTTGKQCIKVNARRGAVTVHNFFDSKPHEGKPFLPLEGRYRLTFSAKGLSPAASIKANFKRLLKPHRVFFSQNITLTDSWNLYTFDFEIKNDDQSGTLDLSFAVTQADVLLDDVELRLLDPNNTTAFRAEVVEALKSLNPGIIRHWAGQLGDDLENQIATNLSRKPNGYSRWSDGPKNSGYALFDALNLCKITGAEPWYVLPITISENEIYNLIEYLAGPADSPFGALRAAGGQVEPWTQVFGTIYLELGNEAWNSIFRGGGINDPKAYGARGATLFSTARSSPYFNPENFKLILGGQATYPERNQTILDHGAQADALAIAPYLMHKADEPENIQTLFQELFQEAESTNSTGKAAENARICRTANKDLTVYEVNLHTTKGAISQKNLDQFCSSAGAGMGLSLHMLNMLELLGVKDQCMYNLSQHSFQRPDKKTVNLWGAIRDLGPTKRKRPQFLAMELCNKALSGDMTSILWRGAPNPEPKLRAFAFKNGDKRSLILFNLDHREPVVFNMTIPAKTVRETRLTFEKFSDVNENEEKVVLKSETLVDISSDRKWTLPAPSMILLQWKTTIKAESGIH